MYIITNGEIVTPDEVLTHHSLVIEDETITKIIPNQFIGSVPPNVTVIDAKGGFVLPGFIDIHSDYIEGIAAPRPTSLMDFELALYEAERELLTHGITTMYHSLSLFENSVQVFREKPIRSSENVIKLLNLIDESNQKSRLIHHRMHLRFEINNFEQLPLVKKLLKEGKIQLLSLMDHTPGQGQYRDLETYRLILAGYHDGDYQRVEEIIQQVGTIEKIAYEDLAELAELAQEYGVPLASHDDDSLEKLEIVTALGSSISEFPITQEVALAAKARGLATVGGAPNILLGKSHAGNLSVLEAVKADSIDILCSDYFPAALLHSIFKLWQQDILTLPQAVRLVTLNPAQAVAIAEETGSLEENKMADVIVVNTAGNHIPVVTHTFAKGVLINETTYRI
ncbi:alpha-D-ribose 1-methylphosphonate 5-triphosphate diphosphatase [Enterococcus sp. LJL90]